VVRGGVKVLVNEEMCSFIFPKGWAKNWVTRMSVKNKNTNGAKDRRLTFAKSIIEVCKKTIGKRKREGKG